MRLTIVFFFICSTMFSQQSRKFECYYLLKKNYKLLKESLELKPDSTYIWRSEYDLSFSIEGTYSLTNNILVLSPEKHLSDEIQNTDFKKYILEGNNIYLLNNKGKKKTRIKDKSLGGFWQWLKGYKLRYIYTEVNEFTFKDN